MMSKSTPDASPAYKGRSSSVICHDPRLSVIGGTGVDDLQSNIQFIVQIICLKYDYTIQRLYTKAITSHYLNIVVSVPGRLVDDGRRFTENESLPFGPNEELID